jgi:hypothetical protein
VDVPSVQISGNEVPDALLVPARWRQGITSPDRAYSIARLAGPILGLPRGSWVHMKLQKPVELPPGKADAKPSVIPGATVPGEMIFVTREIEETLYFPVTHPLAGRDRFAWVKHGEVWWGFHVPEVKETTWLTRGSIVVPALSTRPTANGST